jgi:hypothetical protein
MRYVILALAAIAVLGIVLLLIGAMLPATREGRAEIRITAPPARILAVIRDYQAQPDWRDGIAKVLPKGAGWVEITTRGDEIAFTPETMRDQEILLHFTATSGFSGTWQAKMVVEGGETRITVVETVTTPAPLGRIISRLVFNPEDFATTYLAELKARAEIAP